MPWWYTDVFCEVPWKKSWWSWRASRLGMDSVTSNRRLRRIRDIGGDTQRQSTSVCKKNLPQEILQLQSKGNYHMIVTWAEKGDKLYMQGDVQVRGMYKLSQLENYKLSLGSLDLLLLDLQGSTSRCAGTLDPWIQGSTSGFCIFAPFSGVFSTMYLDMYLYCTYDTQG